MEKLTKRNKQVKEKFNEMGGADKSYGVEEALNGLKSLPPVKFDQTVELAINLGIDNTCLEDGI